MKMTDKFHRAARDGYLRVLKEATKRDCNSPDEDGLTPTALAAHEGNMDALRLIVGRGGNPDKCDHYGNTALHCAAARGHLQCLSFLVNFGVNLWALDNEMHSAKDLAAINNKEEVLRFLDLEEARQEKEDLKKAQRLQGKAKRDAEKRQKIYEKLHRRADKKRVQEQLKYEKERQRMQRLEMEGKGKKSIFYTLSKRSIPFVLGSRKEVRPSPPRFSDLTTNANNNNNKKTLAGIQKKILKRKVQDNSKYDFKVRETEEDGKRSVRNLSGLRHDSQVLFVSSGSLSSATSNSPLGLRRGKLFDVFDSPSSGRGSSLSRAKSEPDFMDPRISTPTRGSLFDRPGFGSVAFRSSITANLSSLQTSSSEANSELSSAKDTSLDTNSHTHTPLPPWEEQDLPSDEDDHSFSTDSSALLMFLSSCNLESFLLVFLKEHIDLDALMLLTDEDLKALQLPLGPRRKLLKAIEDRKGMLNDPGEVNDSSL